MRFDNNTPIGLIKIRGPLGEREIEATIDTGAFKSFGRDILENFKLTINFKDKEFKIEDC